MSEKIEIGAHTSGSMRFWHGFVMDHPDTGHANIDPECIHELSSEPFFRHFAKEFDLSGFDVSYEMEGGELKTQHVSVIFDDDADFQYFVPACSTHDGTLFFTYELIETVVAKVVQACTYYEPCGSPPNGSNITYTVGNFIIVTEFGDYGTDEKPWLHQKDTVLLPVMYEVEDKEQNE